MQIPKPVLLIGLSVAFCLGHLLVWVEHLSKQRHGRTRLTTDSEQVIANERLA